jgi:hypothetical protein
MMRNMRPFSLSCWRTGHYTLSLATGRGWPLPPLRSRLSRQSPRESQSRCGYTSAFFALKHGSWLNQAELLLRAFSEKYLKRFDPPSLGSI